MKRVAGRAGGRAAPGPRVDEHLMSWRCLRTGSSAWQVVRGGAWWEERREAWRGEAWREALGERREGGREGGRGASQCELRRDTAPRRAASWRPALISSQTCLEGDSRRRHGRPSEARCRRRREGRRGVLARRRRRQRRRPVRRRRKGGVGAARRRRRRGGLASSPPCCWRRALREGGLLPRDAETQLRLARD